MNAMIMIGVALEGGNKLKLKFKNNDKDNYLYLVDGKYLVWLCTSKVLETQLNYIKDLMKQIIQFFFG